MKKLAIGICLCILLVMTVCAMDSTAGVYIFDKQEYDQFVSTAPNLPDDFISATDLSVLGEFSGFISYDEEAFLEYMYSLCVQEGPEIFLYISHIEKSDIYGNRIIDISNADGSMRNLKKELRGVIRRNGVEYCYSGGHLLSIRWNAGDVYVSIGVNSDWDDYPEPQEGSILYGLLSLSEEENLRAVAQLPRITFESKEDIMELDAEGILMGVTAILLCVVLIGILLYPIPIAKRVEIKKAWSEQDKQFNWKKVDWDRRYICAMRYYGTFNGYVILFSPGQTAVMTSQEIGGEKFDYTSSFVIYGYKNGQFQNLSELFETGIVDADDIVGIAKAHKKYNG